MVRRLRNSTYLDMVDQTGPEHEEFERPLSGFENLEASSRVILPTPKSAGNSAPASFRKSIHPATELEHSGTCGSSSG